MNEMLRESNSHAGDMYEELLNKLNGLTSMLCTLCHKPLGDHEWTEGTGPLEGLSCPK